jgi:hypothetical protein
VLVEHSTQQVAITTVNYNHTGMFTSNWVGWNVC